MFTIQYGPNYKDGTAIPQSRGLHLTQRNAHGGAIGDVVVLMPGEIAEITLDDADGVQITAKELLNLPVPEPTDPTAPIDQSEG